LLNLNDVDSDHPEPMVQDIRPGGTGGELMTGKAPAAQLLQALCPVFCPGDPSIVRPCRA